MLRKQLGMQLLNSHTIAIVVAALCDTVTEMDRGKVIARSGFEEAQ